MRPLRALPLLAMMMLLAAPARAEMPEFTLTIKDHVFSPPSLEIPAGVKVKLIVDNQDPTPEEFESYDFNREKIIGGNSKATVFVGPLKAGTYKYFGEFNPKTAHGVLVAK